MVAALVSAVVGALVGAALSPVTNNVMALVFKLVEKDSELWEGFKKDMVSLEKDLCMLFAEGEDQLSGKRDPSTARRIYMEDMQELSYDIQDCMDRILCFSECGRGHGRDLAKEVKSLKERLERAKQQNRNNINDSQPLIPEKLRSRSEVRLVGIKEPKEDLLEVLKGHPHEELSVISIAGFSGLGKTALARAVYDDCADQFDCQAWVVATQHKNDATDLQMALQEELSKNHQEYPRGGHDENSITSFLRNKRYLIVLDDIEERQWDHIKFIFPKERRSRIIVTTTNQAVANLCSKHGRDGYVYNMRPLEKTHSKELLDAILKDNLAVSDQNLAQIVEKFDGHPHSLLSLAKYLLRKEEFPGTFWEDLGDRMNDPDEHAFTELQRVLTEHFKSLRGRHNVNLKILLLYMCVFPNTHPVGRSRLIRRWLTEGYVQDADPRRALHVADDNLDKLIELNIVRRIDPSKNAKVKTCRAHGIMHEFLLYIARSINFITDLDDRQRRKYRHLFQEGRPSIGGVSNVRGTSSDEKEELRAHSLTVCGTAGKAAGYFPKCELLRVLDLEECNELEDEHIVDIHMLWHLKYLSLGAKITKVPRDIEKLHCLETLDMRKTQIKVLPVGVIKLPHLTHLLGKFKLEERNWDNNIKADNFLPPRSNLQTLAGFLTDDNPGFPKLMVHMKELNRVKIWCNSNRDNASTLPSQNSVGSNASTPDSPPSENSVGANASTSNSPPSECFTFLLTAIMVFIQSRLDTPGVDHCLSLDLGNSSEEILTSLRNSLQLSRDRSPQSSRDEISCAYLSSLKLHGELHGLTQIISLVGGLKELCLSSTNGLTLDEVSNLTKLEALEYLKLVNISLGVLTSDDFKNLRRLCLVECKGLPIIENGALSNLLSLRILNKDLKGLSNIEIENLTRLQEVGLCSDVRRKTITDWEDAAKKHPRRPRLLFFKMVDSAERPPDAGSSSVMPEEQQIRTDVQSMLELEDVLTSQENREDISSDCQTPNAKAADVHGKMKQFGHYTTDKDVEGQNDKMVDSAERPPDAGSSSVMPEEQQIRTDVQSMLEVEDVLTDQENRDDISSDSQNPNARAADVHGKMKQFSHYTADKDVEGQNDKMVDSAERPPDAGSSSVMLEEQQIRTDVQSMLEVEDMLTGQENRDDISSDSQNPNARAADVHGEMKQFGHYTADKDVEGQNDKMVDSAERPPDAGSSSVMPEEQQIRTDVQSMVEVADVVTAQENRDDISSDSQNPNARTADVHGEMKQFGHYTAGKDVGGQNDKNHNGLTAKQTKKKSEGWPLKMWRKMAVALRKSTVTAAVDNSHAKGKGDIHLDSAA